MATTIADIARKANVAPSTVSVVLNNSKPVSDRIRRQVQQAVAQLGYEPRRRKSRLRVPVTPSVAMVYTQRATVDGVLSQLCEAWLKSIRRVVADSGGQLSLLAGAAHVEDDRMFQQVIAGGDIKGVILAGSRPEDGYAQFLAGHGLPVVAINIDPQTPRVSTVSVDFYDGGYQVADHLVKLGHQRIAILNEEEAELWWVQQRREGLRHRLAEASLKAIKLPWCENLGPSGNDVEAAIEQVVDQALKQRVTALFTGDRVVCRLVDRFEARGISVPSDISLIGFDNLGLSASDGRRPTTVGFSNARIGALAARSLMQMVKPSPLFTRIHLQVPVRLIKGHTTAPGSTRTPGSTPAPGSASGSSVENTSKGSTSRTAKPAANLSSRHHPV